jgi:hypothetical protein
MKTINMFVRRCFHFASAVVILGAMAAAMQAENFAIHVPFPFAVAGKTLPAGDYTVEPVAAGLLMIRGAKATDTVAIAASPAEYKGTANPSLSFANGPDMAVLSGVRMDSGMTFSIMPAKRMAATMAVPAKGTVALSHP